MGCLNSLVSNDIYNLIAGKNGKSRYFDGVQTDGLYGIDVFLNYYQNNVNSAGGNTDLESTANFVRNPNCWAYPLDLTCCSPWNMHPTYRLPGGALPYSSNHMAGTLISPRHVIFCKHTQYYPPAGCLMRFVTQDNQTVTRTMTAIEETPEGDFAVGILDEDVPASISFAKILPDDWQEKFAIVNNKFAPEVLVVALNQDEVVIIQKLLIATAGMFEWRNFNEKIPVDFARAVRVLDSGNPVFMFVDRKPILLSVFSGADRGDNINAYKNVINTTMLALGAESGCTYTLTPANLEPYANLQRDILGVGIVQPQSGIDYPFTAPTDDIRGLVADFQLSIDTPAFGAPPKPPFAIKYLYGIGDEENTAENFLTPTHVADIVVKDSNNAVVFDSTQNGTNFSKELWADTHVIYNWQNESGECHLLANSSCGAIGAPGQTYHKYLTPQNATLDARAVYLVPRRLKSLRVFNPHSGPSTRFAGKINFKNGYNTEIAAGDTTTNNFFVDTRVTINAIEGGGLGKYSNCGCDAEDPLPIISAPTPITKINGIPVTNGDFLLGAADCLYARRPTAVINGNLNPAQNFAVAGHTAVGANCDPCCKCADYADLGLKINQYQSQYAYIGRRVTDIKNIHEQNIQKWLDERNCSLQKTLRLLLVAQRCPYMDVVMMICNPCDNCLHSKSLELVLAPAYAGATAEVVSGYTAMFAANVNGRPWPVSRAVDSLGRTVFAVPFSEVRSSDSAYIRFRVKFSVSREYAVVGTLTGTLLDNTPILAGCDSEENIAPRTPAVAIATQALYCDANGNTNLP